MSLEHEADVVREWSALVRREHPALGERAEELAIAWAATSRNCPRDQMVPLHKDFHAGHVLVGETLWVVDLDEARLGDPAFDVAHFTTYLEVMPAACSWQILRDAFLESYTERSGWRDRGSFDAYRTYTWLKIAKQRALGTGPFPAVPGETRHDLVAAAIAEGERWLNR
jgi:aminoglycoside phosphotransferase (APT) family kinase protein